MLSPEELKRRKWAGALAIALVGMTTLVWTRTPSPSATSPTPTSPRAGEAESSIGSRDRLGLFIGVSRYRDDIGELPGAAADAERLRELFRRKFGFSTKLLTNEAAERDHIRAGFEWLVEQALEANRRKLKPVVVVFFAGHGSQVMNDNDEPNEPLDDPDETWVSFDSSPAHGKRDIRDDEIQTLLNALVELDCQVTLISDSCYSGDVQRVGGGIHRQLRRGKAAGGPESPLLKELLTSRSLWRGNASDAEVAPVATAGRGGAPLHAGYVKYAACKESELAYECREEGASWGRLSFTIHEALSELRKDASVTYKDLRDQIDARFRQRGWARDQTPQFSGSHAVANQALLGRTPIKSSWRAVEVHKVEGHRAWLPVGGIHGVAPTTHFTFYENRIDLEAGVNPSFGGEIVEGGLTAIEAEVRCDKPPRVGQYAKPDEVRFDDLVIRVPEDLPKPLRQSLFASRAFRASSGRREDPPEDLSISLVGRYLELNEPGQQPRRVEVVAGDYALAAEELVEEHVLHLARIRRLLSVRHAENLLDVEVCLRGGRSGWQRSGTVSFSDAFRLRLTNHAKVPLYATVFYVDERGELDILHPWWKEQIPIAAHGGILQVPEPSPKGDHDDAGWLFVEEENRSQFVGTHLIKVIALESDFSFESLKGRRGSLDMGEQVRLRKRGRDFREWISVIFEGTSPGQLRSVRGKWATGSTLIRVRPDQ